MAVFKSEGFINGGYNNLRFLDDLDLVYEYKPQKPAFSLPTINLPKELPKIEVRPSQWYEQYCCTLQGRRSVRKPRPKKPAPLPKRNVPTAAKKATDVKETDECLLPLTPVPNPMPCLAVLRIPHEPLLLPPGIRALRLSGPPLWGRNEPTPWNRPSAGRQPPWAHSPTQLWHKSATLQPGWARSLVHLGKTLQNIAARRAEIETMVHAKGVGYCAKLEKKLTGLRCLTGECVQLLGQTGKRKGDTEVDS